MVIKKILIAIFIIAFFGCNSEQTKPTNPSQPNPPRPRDSSVLDAHRQKLLQIRFHEIETPLAPVTVNTTPTNHHYKLYPKATILSDYNSVQPWIYMAVNFENPFEPNLPSNMLAELKARNLLNKNAVDIFWVIQPLSAMGGNKDGGITNISYLKAHGWADPEIPENFVGDRLDRLYLYGIFSSDIDIAHEVKNDEMKPFRIYIHDGSYSPQTAAIHLPDDKTFSFWSLVIDDKNPHREPKAIATLHWILSDDDDHNHFKPESFTRDPMGRIRNKSMAHETLGDYISMLQTRSWFKDQPLVAKLTHLLR